MIITTDRLIIEPLSKNDDGFILELLNTEGWIKFIGDRNIKAKSDAIAYIQKINGNQSVCYWTVKLKTSKVAIGIITFIKRDYLKHNDIGFAFLPQYSNKGFAYEATKNVLEHLILMHDLTTILAITIPGNLNSIKLLEKIGFQFDSIIEIEKVILHLYNYSIK